MKFRTLRTPLMIAAIAVVLFAAIRYLKNSEGFQPSSGVVGTVMNMVVGPPSGMMPRAAPSGMMPRAPPSGMMPLAAPSGANPMASKYHALLDQAISESKCKADIGNSDRFQQLMGRLHRIIDGASRPATKSAATNDLKNLIPTIQKGSCKAVAMQMRTILNSL